MIVDAETVAPDDRSELAERLGFQDPPADAPKPRDPTDKRAGVAGPATMRIANGPTTTDCILAPVASQVVLSGVALDILDFVVDSPRNARTPRNPDGAVLAGG